MSTQPSPELPPWVNDPSSNWVSAREFSTLYRRSLRRVQQMCKSGEVMDFCVATYKDISGRWWLRVPS